MLCFDQRFTDNYKTLTVGNVIGNVSDSQSLSYISKKHNTFGKSSMFRTKRKTGLRMFREKTNDAVRCKIRLCSERHRWFYLILIPD